MIFFLLKEYVILFSQLIPQSINDIFSIKNIHGICFHKQVMIWIQRDLKETTINWDNS